MEIRWSEFARQDLEQIEDYIGNKFTFREYASFINILNKKINLILEGNVILKKSELNPNFNICFITEQTSLVYKKDETSLKIYRLYNNYQDLDKKFIIKDV